MFEYFAGAVVDNPITVLNMILNAVTLYICFQLYRFLRLTGQWNNWKEWRRYQKRTEQRMAELEKENLP